MELNADRGVTPVANGHDLAVVGGDRRHLEHLGERGPVHDQGVVAPDGERRGSPVKSPVPSCETGEVFPCTTRPARRTTPPNAAPMD